MKTKTCFSLGTVLTLLITSSAPQCVSAQSGGSIVFSHQTTHQIYSMNPSGSETRQLTSGTGSFPVWSPDMRYIAFHRSTSVEDTIYAMEAVGERNGGRIFAVAVNGGDSGLDWSSDGRSIVFPGTVGAEDGLWSVAVDLDTGAVGSPVLLRAGHCAAPACSPDGTKIALVTYPGPHISVLDLASGAETLIPNGYAPAFSPDSSVIAYRGVGPVVTTKGGKTTITWHSQIFVANVDGTDINQLTSQKDYLNFPRWSPDMTEIAFWKQINGADSIHKLNLATGATTLLKKGGNTLDWVP